MPDRIARATRAVVLDVSKTFDRDWHTCLPHKLKSYGISGQIFGFISCLSNRQLLVVLGGNPSQEYPVNVGVPQVSILGPTLFLIFINDLADDVICNIAIMLMVLPSTLNVIRHLILSQQLELGSELESDLEDTVD